MILYVNGDSHTAAAEAVNPHVFACDDGTGEFWRLGKQPHPDNDRVSWGFNLANRLESAYVNQSQSASSNYRILRTARSWIQSNQQSWADLVVIIQWSTWERDEWLIDGEYLQINASGLDDVPDAYRDRYRQFVIDVDWARCTEYWHDQIWQFHLELLDRNIPHVFFNGNNHFGSIEQKKNWGAHYLSPYLDSGTYDQILRRNGYRTVNPKSWHFGADAHCFWAQHLLQYMINNNLVERPCDMS